MEKLLIRTARVIDPSDTRGAQEGMVADVLIGEGRIEAVGHDLPAQGARVVPAAGLVCAPGLVDLHVHLRDPGQTHKEDVCSGCRAAAAGGVTSLFCMPNTSPALDDAPLIADLCARAEAADARVYPVGAVTKGLKGERLTDFAALKAAGAAALSDDGRPVLSADLAERAMREAAQIGLPLMMHCEELSLVRGGLMNEGAVSRQLGVPGVTRAAEEVGTAREIALAAATGCPVHICHVSTKNSVAMIRAAQRDGVRVTGETAPHYLMLTDEALRARDADFRMSPPLRTREDVDAVIEGLRDGTLCAVATDHAPHTRAEKADFAAAPNGAIGMETSLAVCLTALVHTNKLSLRRLLQAMSFAPASLAGIPAGTLAVGAAADLVLFDPNEEWTVDENRLLGKSHNTPFKGMTLKGRVRMTVCGGRVVYTAENR